jgi:hypothetical protein
MKKKAIMIVINHKTKRMAAIICRLLLFLRGRIFIAFFVLVRNPFNSFES